MSMNLALVILFTCAAAETHALGDSRQEAETQQCTTKECATNTDPTSLLMTRQSVSELSGHHAMKDMELDQTMSAKAFDDDLAEKRAAEQDGYVIKYSKIWPHCADIICPGTRTRAEYGRMCEGYGSLCTGFSFTHGYSSNQRGSGCLKKCGATEFGGFGTGNHDYWAKPEAPTTTAVPTTTTAEEQRLKAVAEDNARRLAEQKARYVATLKAIADYEARRKAEASQSAAVSSELEVSA